MARKKSAPRLTQYRIFILVDGKSEQHYLRALKKTEDLNQIDLKPELCKRKSITDQCKMLSEQLRHYDRVIWLVDYDHIAHKGLQIKFKDSCDQLKNKDKACKLHILINSPSIEFWYLLHFQQTDRYFPLSTAVESELKRHLHDYNKCESYQKEIYGRLREHLPKAQCHAKRLSRESENPIGARADIVDLFLDDFQLLRKPTV